MLVWLSVCSEVVNNLQMVQLMQLVPIISCFTKIENGSTFLVPVYPGCTGKEVIKRMLFTFNTFKSLHRQTCVCFSQHLPVKHWTDLLEYSFTADMPFLTATSTFGLWARGIRFLL